MTSPRPRLLAPFRFSLLPLLALTLSAATFLLAAESPPAKSAPAPATDAGAIRIRCGSAEAHTDEAGVTWLPGQGFADGEMMDRPGTAIGNTKTPSLYGGEHFAMSSFSRRVPHGRYLVKLHFAITYEGIGQPGQVVFSLNVEGTELKDFDIWKKAGGPARAYVESVPVTVTDGQLDILFTTQSENPTISAIEIIPAK